MMIPLLDNKEFWDHVYPWHTKRDDQVHRKIFNLASWVFAWFCFLSVKTTRSVRSTLYVPEKQDHQISSFAIPPWSVCWPTRFWNHHLTFRTLKWTCHILVSCDSANLIPWYSNAIYTWNLFLCRSNAIYTKLVSSRMSSLGRCLLNLFFIHG